MNTKKAKKKTGRPTKYHSALASEICMRMAAGDHGSNLGFDLVLSELNRADIDQIPTCPPLELKAWAAALSLRLIRERGTVPQGWNRVKGLSVPHPADEIRI